MSSCVFHRSQLYANIVIPSLLNENLLPSDKKWFNSMGPDKAWRAPIRFGGPVLIFLPFEKFSLWGPVPLDHILHVFRAIWKPIEKLSCSVLQFKSKTRLKSCILGLNFEWFGPGWGKVKCIASCNILAVSNNPVEYCFVMKTTSYRRTYTTRDPGPLNSKICSMSLFSQRFLCS